MPDQVEQALRSLERQLAGRVSRPGKDGYAARDYGLPLSVRGGGHDWASRALCTGVVIDLSGMNGVSVDADHHGALISGGARASDVARVTDPLGLAAVTGSVGAVGMAGLTLGGGYGPLIGRFGLALDNLLAAEVVLADGRVVVADDTNETELFWALRGGGGNFGVVTAMRHRLHELASVCSGVLVYPFCEARAVLERCADIAAEAPRELTVQVGCVAGLNGPPLVLIVPTWCGLATVGETRTAPFLRLGTLLSGALTTTSYRTALSAFDAYLVDGQRTFMETSWLPELDNDGTDAFIGAMAAAVSPGCAVFTHEFKGAASKVTAESTAFGLRREHVLVEILAVFVDPAGEAAEERHRQWARAARQALADKALPGGYPNLLVADDAERVANSYGPNAKRLMATKRHYDPGNVFCSAIPLPVGG